MGLLRGAKACRGGGVVVKRLLHKTTASQQETWVQSQVTTGISVPRSRTAAQATPTGGGTPQGGRVVHACCRHSGQDS